MDSLLPVFGTAAMNTHPLDRALRAAGMSQMDLSRLATVPQPQVSAVIKGATHPGGLRRFGPDAAQRIVTVLESRGVTFTDDDGANRALSIADLVLPYKAPPVVSGPGERKRTPQSNPSPATVSPTLKRRWVVIARDEMRQRVHVCP
jgi:hypothetical protein